MLREQPVGDVDEMLGGKAELLLQQPQDYREKVLPPTVKARISVEQASTYGWERYVGESGATVGMTTFGASAKP